MCYCSVTAASPLSGYKTSKRLPESITKIPPQRLRNVSLNLGTKALLPICRRVLLNLSHKLPKLSLFGLKGYRCRGRAVKEHMPCKSSFVIKNDVFGSVMLRLVL